MKAVAFMTFILSLGFTGCATSTNPDVASSRECNYAKLLSEPIAILFKPGRPVAGESIEDALADDDSVTALRQNGDLLLCSWEGIPLRAVGLTDPSECEARECGELALRRARKFNDWLTAYGVPSDRLLMPKGLGNVELRAEPGTDRGRRINPRAYLQIQP